MKSVSELTSTPFQEWLRGEIEARDWTQAKLGREIEVFKGTIGRWLHPTNHPLYRVPDPKNLRKLADLFGVDFSWLMELTGLDDEYSRDTNLSEIQHKCIAAVKLLSDDVLDIVHAQLRGLLETESARRSTQ